MSDIVFIIVSLYLEIFLYVYQHSGYHNIDSIVCSRTVLCEVFEVSNKQKSIRVLPVVQLSRQMDHGKFCFLVVHLIVYMFITWRYERIARI